MHCLNDERTFVLTGKIMRGLLSYNWQKDGRTFVLTGKLMRGLLSYNWQKDGLDGVDFCQDTRYQVCSLDRGTVISG